jgi:hypothetical protein
MTRTDGDGERGPQIDPEGETTPRTDIGAIEGTLEGIVEETENANANANGIVSADAAGMATTDGAAGRGTLAPAGAIEDRRWTIALSNLYAHCRMQHFICRWPAECQV